jgi:NADPH-dependent 2,4-dienoyl-CoA reductase/sulfur reductase-like enzyme
MHCHCAPRRDAALSSPPPSRRTGGSPHWHGTATSTDACLCQERHSASCNFANQDLTPPLRLHNSIRVAGTDNTNGGAGTIRAFHHQASDTCEAKKVQYRVTPRHGRQEQVPESTPIPAGNDAIPTRALQRWLWRFFWYAMNRPLEQHQEVDRYAAARKNPPLVIIGAGAVGQRVAAEFLQQSLQKPVPVILFGDEPRELYDRVQLSGYLAGDIPDIAVTGQLDTDPRLTRLLGTRIMAIDRERRVVIDCNGESCPWSRLVLATGSRASVPPVPGVELAHVYRFRDLNDAEQLMARTVRSRHTVVIGGGLLGLEAARAMRRFNTRVTVVEQAAHLMFHQLDADGAALLNAAIHHLGIEVISGVRVKQLCGSTRVEAVELADGNRLACDTVVIATGITPNIELARDCGLHYRRGILVDDQMCSSDPCIFAAGECAEHRNRVYGLVAPGYEQAVVVAHALARKSVSYKGSLSATRLKVAGCKVFSIGEIQVEWPRRTVEYLEGNGTIYRKLFLVGNRLDAAYALGTWQDVSRIQEAVRRRQRLWPWQLKRFRQTGSLWQTDSDDSVAGWPATATLCNCKGIARGNLSRAVDQGNRDPGASARQPARPRFALPAGRCCTNYRARSGPLWTTWWNRPDFTFSKGDN